MNTPNKPIKLVNPLSDHPTEMWLQVIADFEAILNTPGYKIDMGFWHILHPDGYCLVCMAGASMARGSQGLPIRARPKDYAQQDRRKFESINIMREGHFKQALEWLNLPRKDKERWLEAIQAADLEGTRSSLYSVYLEEDWPELIRLLREAIARINAEYERLNPASE